MHRETAAYTRSATIKSTGRPCRAPAAIEWTISRLNRAGSGQTPVKAQPNSRNGGRAREGPPDAVRPLRPAKILPVSTFTARVGQSKIRPQEADAAFSWVLFIRLVPPAAGPKAAHRHCRSAPPTAPDMCQRLARPGDWSLAASTSVMPARCRDAFHSPSVLQNAQVHRAPLLWHDVSQPLLRHGVERLNAFGIGDVDRAAAVQHKAVVVGQELVPVLCAAALAACSRLS